jgi:nitrate reductase gamma subunit
MTDRPTRKAGLWQVAVTIFFALLMIGRKDTWEREGATVTMAQMIVGAIVGAVVVIGTLVLLVRLATN